MRIRRWKWNGKEEWEKVELVRTRRRRRFDSKRLETKDEKRKEKKITQEEADDEHHHHRHNTIHTINISGTFRQKENDPRIERSGISREERFQTQTNKKTHKETNLSLYNRVVDTVVVNVNSKTQPTTDHQHQDRQTKTRTNDMRVVYSYFIFFNEWDISKQ
jgi:hypothetical protein